MVGLVSEIQRDALDESIPVSALLRKVKLAAVKLQLLTVEDWVTSELNGYSGDLPMYRQLSGTPRARNPYQGWLPIFGSQEYMNWVSTANIRMSVGALHELLRNDSQTMMLPLSHNVVRSLNKSNDGEIGEAAVFIGRAALAGILDRVRTMVLEWAIELERSGIQGENMSFSSDEKKAAGQAAGISIASITNFTGFMGDNNTVQNIVGGNLNLQKVEEVASQLQDHHADLARAGADGPMLERATNMLLAELSRPKPDQGAISGYLQDARNALSGAAGNLMASGAMALIATFLPGVAG